MLLAMKAKSMSVTNARAALGAARSSRLAYGQSPPSLPARRRRSSLDLEKLMPKFVQWLIIAAFIIGTGLILAVVLHVFLLG